jgi:hypothetical protein
MTYRMQFLAVASIGLAGCLLSACAPEMESDTGTGGAVGQPGSGGMAPGSGGSATGGVGSGGSASGGVTGSGGAAAGSGGSATGGAASGGRGTGGTAGGGAGSTGSGGNSGTGGQAGGRGGAGGSGRGGAAATGGASGGGGGSSGSYNPCPTNGDPCRILPVGDSITFGINQEGSYRIELFRKAVAAKQKITFTGTLQNGPTMVDGVTFPRRYEATSGITIDGISSQITRNNTLSMPSDIILVHIGTNDMYMSDPGGAPQRLGTLLDKLIAGMPNALIVVAKIIPLPSGAAAVKTFNAAIPGVIQTRVAAGKHILLVDMNTTFPSSGMSSDNVHPNASGYAWMGGIWYETIGPLLPK